MHIQVNGLFCQIEGATAVYQHTSLQTIGISGDVALRGNDMFLAHLSVWLVFFN